MSASLLEQIQADVTAALKAGEKERVGALRLVLSELQKDAKEGGADPEGVLKRERKRRLDAAEQFRDAGRPELSTREQAEADLIQTYLPAELSDQELSYIVEQAVQESGAAGPGEMGKAMPVVMQWVAGRADGRRVSAKVREVLARA